MKTVPLEDLIACGATVAQTVVHDHTGLTVRARGHLAGKSAMRRSDLATGCLATPMGLSSNGLLSVVRQFHHRRTRDLSALLLPRSVLHTFITDQKVGSKSR